MVFAVLARVYYVRKEVEGVEKLVEENEDASKDHATKKGKDIDAVKKGDTK